MLSTLLSVNIFYRSPLTTTFTGARSASGVYLFISQSPKFISAIPKTMIRHYSSIIFTCHPFKPLSISLLRVGNPFLISSPFDVTKLQKIILMFHRLTAFHSQCQWTRIHILPPLWRWGLNLDLNGIERVIISMFSKTMVSTLLSVNIFIGPSSFMGTWGGHKRHHGCYYSYHRILNSNILIRH